MKTSRFNKLINLIVTLASLLIIMIIVLFSGRAGEISLKAGDACHEDIYAPRAVIDEITTEMERQNARDQIKDSYKFNPETGEKSISDVTVLFDNAEVIRATQELSTADRITELINKSPIEISSTTASEIIYATDQEFNRMTKITDLVENVMEEPVSDEITARENCFDEIEDFRLSAPQKDALDSIISSVVVKNMEFDKEKTEAEKEAAAAKIPDIEKKKNQIIIRKGDVATEAQIDMLSKLGMLKGSNPLSVTYSVGVLLLVIICYAILVCFFWDKFRKQMETIPILAITALIIILISFYGARYLPHNMLSAIPFGIFPGIAAIFTSSAPTSIITNLILSIFCGVVLDASWSYTVCLILAGTATAYAFAAVKRRSNLLPAAVMSAAFYALTFCAMSLVEVANTTNAFASLGKGLLGGILSGLITIGSIQFFEWFFNATTPMKLSELTNPENKLLKKLLVEAPGSYHHSLTVANISEIAARSIKADSLLARVGAYYHDIGKIRHPLYFKENQYDTNAHDNLTPEQSSAMIINHVADGVEMAKRNRLPQVVTDIIAQHHGTTTTGYFLIRAKALDPDADESKFTYPGPIPMTKEAAIVMLSDSCEAAVRSIDDKTEAKIEAMVRKIATERVNSGQFSQCNLTFAELETVIKVITKTLGGYFHERIKYE